MQEEVKLNGFSELARQLAKYEKYVRYGASQVVCSEYFAIYPL